MKHTTITLSDEDWDALLMVLDDYCGDYESRASKLIATVATHREAAIPDPIEVRNESIDSYTTFPPGETTIQPGDRWEGALGEWLFFSPINFGKTNGIPLKRPIT